MIGKNFDLVDRIAAQADRGIVVAPQPDNAESAHRARFPGDQKSRDRGWAGEIEMRRCLLLLEEMLRTQAGVHVRQPSHHAAPFRAVAFATDVGPFDLDGGAAVVTIDLLSGAIISGTLPSTFVDFGGDGGGASGVPLAHRGVITHVSVALTQLAAEAVATTPGFATGVTFTLRKNDIPIPGLTNRFPDWWYSVPEVGGVLSDQQDSVHMTRAQSLLWAPINLEQDDVITAEASVPISSLTLEILCKVGGYVYPTRVDEPSIRGTIVD